ERLVVLHGNFVTPGMYRSTDRRLSFSWPKYRDFRDHCDVFQGVAAVFGITGSLEYNGAAEPVDVELVSGNYFDVVGVRPAVGRVLNPSDNRSLMGHPVVVLGYSYWQRRFGGDPSIVGREVHVDGMAMTVVGVSAAGFHSIERSVDAQIRVPMAMKTLFTPGWPGLGDQFWAWLNIVARVKPGISLRQAEAGANVYYHQVLAEEIKNIPATYAHRKEFLSDHLDLIPAANGLMDVVNSWGLFFKELLGLSSVVLLIACVNLAGLLVARTQARQRELAIRLALGAGRWGVVRQLMCESLILAAAGGGAGIAIASLLLRPASEFLLEESSRLIDTHMDWRVLLFTLAATTGTAVVFAVAPALQLRRLQLAGVLKNESGASSSRSQVRLRKVMVTAQLGLCVWLLIGAGLFARSLSRLRAADLGFQKEHLITFRFDPMVAGYKPDQAESAVKRLSAALSRLPGVTAVGRSDYGLLTGDIDVENLKIEGYTPPPPDPGVQVWRLTVSPGYFQAIGARLVAGRDFSDADVQVTMRTTIVDQAFADRYFHGQNPVGRHVVWLGDPKGTPVEIVGMVANQSYNGPESPAGPFFYSPGAMYDQLSFYVRTSQAPDALLTAVRQTIRREAPGVPANHLRTMEAFFESIIHDDITIAGLATIFGLLATAIAAIGLYGVTAYSVSRRTREIGIRMALGAARGSVMRMVLREVAFVIVAGAIAGLPTGLLLARLVRSQLYNVSPVDAISAAIAVLVVAMVALIAGLLPARRATTVDPMRALRWE
ncbi:MAG TPA: ABC transporter permease, partial [Bryobacteraceae bacterium]|nr:ABC transporter permease [Bryobacteraceae bacterium]